MNKEMKKNKKMVLALVIVAALAMVSVAAVAIHSDDSAAAGSGQYYPMDSNNPYAIDGTITTDFEFYVNVGEKGQQDITITSNANYTGTITIGTVDKTVTPWDYVPYASIKMTNASNVVMSADIDTTGIAVASFTLCNPVTDPINASQVSSDGVYELQSAPSGTFELLQGSVMLGADEDNFFNGAVTAAGFTATSEFAFGTVLGISADGTAQISGDVQAGKLTVPDPMPTGWVQATDAPTPTLSLSGSASIQVPDATQQLNDSTAKVVNDVLTTEGVNVTIADGAEITAGDRAATLATEVVIDGAGISEGVLFDANGKKYVGDATDPTKLIFENVPMGNYTLFMSTSAGQYLGNATVTPTGITISSTNTLPANKLAIDALYMNTSTPKDLAFDSGVYTFMSALDLKNFVTGSVKLDNLASEGVITFNGKSYTAGDPVLVILREQATGQQEAFWGTVDTTNVNNWTGALKVATGTAAITDPAQIRGGVVTTASAVTNFVVKDDAVVNIYGKLTLLYVSDDQYGSFDISEQAYVDLNADGGLITQGVKAPAAGNGESPSGTIFASKNLVAAYYWTNDTTATPATATYYFTSLENAIKNSNTVTLVGHIVILKDTTLTSPNSDPLKVIIGQNATLQVGRDKIDDDNPAISAILTIPEGTTLINPYGNDYSVVNGQASYDVNKPTPKSNEPACDVLITGNDKYIYTDLATALDISTGNVTIDTLQEVKKLMRSATVNTGVTLNDTFGITIPEDMTLTVNGTVNSTADMIIDGTLTVNNIVNFGSASTVTLKGSIVINKDGTLNLKGTTLNGVAPDSALIIDGTLNMTGNAKGNVDTVYFEGTATITKLTVDSVLRIGAVPQLSSGYVNSADLTGKLTLGADAVAWVYGGFNGKTAFDNATLLSTAYMIDTTTSITYLTIFVDGASKTVDLPMVYGDEFGATGYMLDIAISDWNNNRMLRGDSLIDNSPGGPAFVGADNWTVVYADWSAKQYKVTFNYTPGVTWSCNGQTIDSNNNFAMVDYGASISVQAFVQPGYEGTPVIQKDGTAVSGNPYSTTVTGPVTFSIKDGSVQVSGTGTTDNNSSSGLSLIEILLIIIVIIIAIMAIIIAIRLLRS